MNFEERLSAELSGMADGLERPDVSVPGLERAGRREQVRRRTAFAAAGAAAAVIVVIAAGTLPKLGSTSDTGPAIPPPTASADPGDAPQTLADLPEGAPTDLPWWQDGVLHVGESEIDTAFKAIAYAGGTTIVGKHDWEQGSAWFLVDGDQLVPLLTSPGGVEPVISSDGRTIAWSDPVGATVRRLVAWDVASRSEVDSIDVTVHPVCCDAGGELFINGVDLDGRVVYNLLGEPGHVWAPGGADVEITGIEGILLGNEVWPGGVMWQGRSRSIFELRGVYATVDAAGAVHRVGSVETDQLGTWSPDGTAYAYLGQADGTSVNKQVLTNVWIERIDTGERTRLLLPADRRFEIVAWETPTSLVLQTRNNFGEPAPSGEPHGLAALVRCDTVTGGCERSGNGPEGNAELPPQR